MIIYTHDPKTGEMTSAPQDGDDIQIAVLSFVDSKGTVSTATFRNEETDDRLARLTALGVLQLSIRAVMDTFSMGETLVPGTIGKEEGSDAA